MATLKEIIYNVKNLKSGGVQTDEVALSDEQYAFIIDYYRATLIRQEISNGKTINPRIIQPLGKSGKVELVKAPRSEAGEVPGCDIYKTKLELPAVVETAKRNLWTLVGPTFGGLPYQRSSLNKIVWDRYSRFTKHLTKWYESGPQIYVVTEHPLREVAIQGVFENPREVLKFNEEYNPFDPYEFEYPISTTLLDRLYKMMIDAEIKFSAILPPDLSNDGNDQPTQQQ